MASGVPWSRSELLAAFRLYCRTPFGRLHTRNPDIQALAARLGRTDNAVGMKACNFASLDPAMAARKVRGLANASVADRRLWDQFLADSARIADEAEAAYEHFMGLQPPEAQRPETQFPHAPPSQRPGAADTPKAPPGPQTPDRPHAAKDSQIADRPIVPVDELALPEGPATVERLIRARRLQGFFRDAVLTSYTSRCCLTGIAIPALLNASHIIPHAHNPRRAADPHNGLCLNTLHDRAFDRGLISFDPDLRLILSPHLKTAPPGPIGDLPPAHRRMFLDLEGTPLRLPERFRPDEEALRYHRETVFAASG